MSPERSSKLNFAGHVGHQEKWIYVTTNVAGSEPVLLSLAVDIPPEVTIQPEFVMWRVGDPLEPKTMRVVIPGGTPTKLVAAQADNPTCKFGSGRSKPERMGSESDANEHARSGQSRGYNSERLSVRNPASYSAYARVQ